MVYQLEQFIPECRLLTSLQKVEKKVDMHLAEKHLRIKEAVGYLLSTTVKILLLSIMLRCDVYVPIWYGQAKKMLRFLITHEA